MSAQTTTGYASAATELEKSGVISVILTTSGSKMKMTGVLFAIVVDLWHALIRALGAAVTCTI
jgi:hypothetical protein